MEISENCTFNEKDTVDFLYRSIEDMQSTIRAVDVKSHILLTILLLPLLSSDAIRTYLCSILLTPSPDTALPFLLVHMLPRLLLVITWLLSICLSIKSIWPISNPAGQVIMGTRLEKQGSSIEEKLDALFDPIMDAFLKNTFYLGGTSYFNIGNCFFNKKSVNKDYFREILNEKENVKKKIATENHEKKLTKLKNKLNEIKKRENGYPYLKRHNTFLQKLPENLITVLVFEQMKLAYIRDLKIKRNTAAFFCAIAGLVLGAALCISGILPNVFQQPA